MAVEGHTAHETEAEAHVETLKMLDVYADFAENVLAIPVIKGAKTDSEKFPGAVTTYCIEGLMQDGKALQCGTSHDLGQNFSKAFEIKFLGRDQQQAFAWTTSWGVSTRTHRAAINHGPISDDEGLVLPLCASPPDVAAIVPIYKALEDEAKGKNSLVDKIIAALTEGKPTNDRTSRPGNLSLQRNDGTADRRRLPRHSAPAKNTSTGSNAASPFLPSKIGSPATSTKTPSSSKAEFDRLKSDRQTR